MENRSYFRRRCDEFYSELESCSSEELVKQFNYAVLFKGAFSQGRMAHVTVIVELFKERQMNLSALYSEGRLNLTPVILVANRLVPDLDQKIGPEQFGAPKVFS